MKTMASRWLVYGVGLLLLLAVAALAAVRVYLGSAGARQMITEQLTAQLGSPVEIDGLDVGTVGSSQLRGLRILDGKTQKPFITIDSVHADLSALNLMAGKRTPGRLDADGVHIVLHFNENGDLLTTLPNLSSSGGPTPALHIAGGELTLNQKGRAPLVLRGINLTMSRAKSDNLSGTLDDQQFGHFDVSGDAGDALALSLRGKTPRVTAKMLRDLPFVPPAVWQTVEAEGTDVPLKLDFTFQKAAPQVLYRVGFGNARARLLQTDRPPFAVYPTGGELHGQPGEFHLKGNINDPYWGDWDVRVRDTTAEAVTLVTLQTKSVAVDQKKLEGLPYVPKYVWQQVQAAGKTSALVDVRIPGTSSKVHYKVDLGISDADVTISSVALKLNKTSGQVVIDDGVVSLDKVVGAAGDGNLTGSAKLNFRSEPSKLAFNVNIRDVSLRQLPSQWELPKQIEGKLSGKAEVSVTLRDHSPPELHGSGEGQINDAKLLGFKAAQPIKLSLHGDGKRLRFKSDSPFVQTFLSTLLIQPMIMLVPSPGRPSVAHAARAPADVTPDAAAELAGRALSGIDAAGQRIAANAVETLRAVGGLRKLPQAKETTYLDARIALNDIDIGELVKRLELKLPIALSGKLSVEVLLGVPVNNANSLRDYRLNGKASSKGLVIAGVHLQDLKAQVNYARGLLRLSDFSGKVVQGDKSGSFAGSATMQVVPRGELSVEGKLDSLPTEALAKAVPALNGRLGGSVSGEGKARVKVDNLGDPAAWQGSAGVTSPALTAFGMPLRDLSANAVLADGKASVSDLKANLYKGTLSGTAQLDLAGTGPFQSNFRLRGVDLAGPGALLPKGFSLQGNADLAGTVSGTTSPVKVTGKGTVATRKVRFGQFNLDDLASDWTLTGDTLRLAKIRGSLYKGVATGSVEIQLGGPTGKAKVHLEKLDAATLSKAIEGVPVKISGQVNADGEVNFSTAGGKTAVSGTVDLSATTLRLQGITTSKLHGKAQWKGNSLNYRLEGAALGGTFSVEGTYPPPARSSADEPHGWLRLNKLRLGRLLRSQGLGDAARPLTGSITVTLPFRFDGPQRVPVGNGRFQVTNIRWNDTDIAEDFRGDVRLGRGSISLSDDSSTFAGGRLSLRLLYRFAGPSGYFVVALRGAEAGTLFTLLGGDRQRFQGPVDIRLRGEIGREWNGTGNLVLSRGRISGVTVSDFRVPVDFSFAPSAGRGEVHVRESTAQLGTGRARLRGNLTYDGSWRVEGTLGLLDASLAALGGLVGDVSSYITGRISGEAVFSGSDLRSPADASATVRATLRDAQALQVPVLSVLTPYILPGNPGRQFNKGELRGQLSRGIFRISSLTLESNIAQLVIFGSITIAGRLDLDVTAQTSNLGFNPILLRLLARGLPAVGPLPISLILRVSDLLANRVIHLRVGGTVRNPVVQVEPIRLLSETAVRFFLTQSLRTPGGP